VVLVLATQTLSVEPGEKLGHYGALSWETSVARVVHEPDSKAITGLTWVSVPQRAVRASSKYCIGADSFQPILVHFRPGLVHIWYSATTPEQPEREFTFRLQTQKTSTSSSFLWPVSGVAYVEKYDTLVLSLHDGTFHTIYSFSAEPTLTPPSEGHPTAAGLSATARTTFARAVGRPVRKAEMCTINGMQSYGGSQTFIWVHE